MREIEQYKRAIGAQGMGEPLSPGEDYRDLEECEECRNYTLHLFASLGYGKREVFGVLRMVYRYEVTCSGCKHISELFRIPLS